MGVGAQKPPANLPIFSHGECPATLAAFAHVINRPGGIMNKDQVKGRAEEAKGKVKEVAGRISGDKELEQKGKLQNVGGKIQAGYGDLKKDIKKNSA
jgi:uncharacterized protein YjbJ (UPF0337 family)